MICIIVQTYDLISERESNWSHAEHVFWKVCARSPVAERPVGLPGCSLLCNPFARPDAQVAHSVLQTQEILFSMFYVLEMMLKLLAYGFNAYVRSTSNQVDGVLTLVGILGVIMTAVDTAVGSLVKCV